MNETKIKEIFDKLTMQILELLNENNKILARNLELMKENMELHKRCREMN